MRLTAFSDVSLRIMMLLSSLQEGEKTLDSEDLGGSRNPLQSRRKICGVPRQSRVA